MFRISPFSDVVGLEEVRKFPDIVEKGCDAVGNLNYEELSLASKCMDAAHAFIELNKIVHERLQGVERSRQRRLIESGVELDEEAGKRNEVDVGVYIDAHERKPMRDSTSMLCLNGYVKDAIFLLLMNLYPNEAITIETKKCQLARGSSIRKQAKGKEGKGNITKGKSSSVPSTVKLAPSPLEKDTSPKSGEVGTSGIERTAENASDVASAESDGNNEQNDEPRMPLIATPDFALFRFADESLTGDNPVCTIELKGPILDLSCLTAFDRKKVSKNSTSDEE